MDGWMDGWIKNKGVMYRAARERNRRMWHLHAADVALHSASKAPGAGQVAEESGAANAA